MLDWTKLWPIALTLVVGVMGYATLQADVELLQKERDRWSHAIDSIPLIKKDVEVLTKQAERLESLIEKQNDDRKDMMKVLLDSQRKVDSLSDYLMEKNPQGTR